MVASSVSKVELSWEQVFSGDLPENPARKAWREAVAAVAEKAKAALPNSVNGRVEKAVQIVLSGDIEPCEGGKYIVGSQSDAGLHYVVDGVCECKDSDRPEINSWCKHKIAAALHKRAHALLQQKLAQLDASATRQNTQAATTTGRDDAQAIPQAVRGTTGLPEAPASCNVYVTLAGRRVQLTLRDSDEARMLARLEQLLQRFPTDEEAEQAPAEGWCAKHDVQMKLNHNAKGSWYSHKTADGWCRGK